MIPEKGILNKIAFAIGLIIKSFLEGLGEDNSNYEYERNTRIFDEAIESIKSEKRSNKKKATKKNTAEKKLISIRIYEK